MDEEEQHNQGRPTLEEIWGVGEAGSQASEPASSVSTQSESQVNLADIWQLPPEPTVEQLTSDSPTPPQEEPQGGFWSDVGRGAAATGAAFVEGFAYGIDIFDVDEEAGHPWVVTGARVLGEVTRMIGEMAISAGAVSMIRGIPWISRALSKGGSAVTHVTGKVPGLGRVVDKGRPLINLAARESAEGLVFTGIDQLVAPEERKPGTEGAIMNLAQFAGGGIGFRAATKIIERIGPRTHPVLQRIVGFSGDIVGGSLAAYGLYEDKSDILTEAFAAETIAIGVIDVITYAMSKGRLNPTPEALHALDKAKRAKELHDFTNSPADEAAMWEALNEAIEASLPEGAGFTFERDLIDNISKDWLNDVEAQRNPERGDVQVTPESPSDLEPLPTDTPSPEQPTPAELPQPPRPEPTAPPEVETFTVPFRLTGESIVQTFNYNSSRSQDIGTQLELLRTYGYEAGFEVDQLAALAKIESDFRNVGNELSSAKGPLQVTNTALLDLALKRIDPNMPVRTAEERAEALRRIKTDLGIDVDTLEGRIQAGIEYLKVLRDHYGFSGDELIAAYFSGPTYVRRNGITDEVIAGQISNREYVRRYREALEDIRRASADARVVPPAPTTPTVSPQRITPPEATTPTPERAPTVEPPPSVTPEAAPTVTPSTVTPKQVGAPPTSSPTVTPSPPSPEPTAAPEPSRPTPKDPVEAAEVAEPLPAHIPTPGEVRSIWLDTDSLVYIKFEGTPDALLYDFAGRLRKEKSALGEWQIGYARENLRSLLGLSDEADIDALARAYRQRLEERAKTLEPEQALVVPTVVTRPHPVRSTTPQVITRTPEPREPQTPQVITRTPPPREVDPPQIISRTPPPREGEVPQVITRTPDEPVRTPDESARQPEETVTSPEETVTSPEETVTTTPTTPRMDSNVRRVWDVTVTPEKESLGYREAPPPSEQPEISRLRDTSQAQADFEKQIQEFGRWLVNHPGEVSPEMLRRLREEIKPSAGFSINTTRLRSSGAVLESIWKMADIVHDPTVQPLKEVEGKARRLLRAEARSEASNIVRQLGLLKKDAEILAEVLQRAPETITALRGVNMANGAELMERAERMATLGPSNVSDLEAAQFLHALNLQYSLTGTLKSIRKQIARSLGAGRIVVGDRMVDLSEIDLRDLVASTDANVKVSGIIEAAGGKEAIVKKAKKLVEAKSLADLNKRVRKEADDKVWMRAFIEQRSSGLLTNFRTAVTNAASQMLHTFSEHAVNFTAATMALPARMIGRGKGRMTFSEATARLIGEVSGMTQAFVRPVVRIRDGMGIDHARKLPSVIDILSMMIHDPLRLATNLEDALRHTSLSSRLDVEGARSNAATSAKLKNTPTGKALSRIADILGFPLRVASLGKLRSSDIMWGFFDQAAAAQRLLGYGMMELADRPFTYGGYYSELAGQLYRRRKAGENVDGLFEQVIARRREKLLASRIEQEALASGLSGDALVAKRTEIRDRITKGVLKDLDEAALRRIDEIDEAALQNARHMTFKDEIETPLGRTFEGLINRHPAMRIILPFYHTPFRILEKAAAMTPGLAYTPGFLTKTRDDLRGVNGKRAQELAYARWAVGTSLYMTGAILAMNNLLTPTATDEGEYRRMQEAGLPEHSIRIGDKWIDINKLDPAPAFFFVTMANVVKVVRNIDDETTAEEIASAAFTTILRSITDKTWLTSLREFLDALYGINSENYLANLLDSAVPFKGLRTMAETWPMQGINPLYRDHMMEFNGFLERYMPTRTALDTFGKERETYEHFMGMRYSTPSDSPIRQELVKLGLTLPRLDRVVNHVELSDDQYWQLRRYLDTEAKAEDRLNALVRSSSYQRASIEQKKEMILGVWAKAREQARARIRRDPEYQKAYREYVDRTRQERQNRSYDLPDFFKDL